VNFTSLRLNRKTLANSKRKRVHYTVDMGEATKSHVTLVHDHKRTKIIATLGPATHSFAAVRQLIADGADGMRLNFSHGTMDEKAEQIEWIRRASKELHKPVAIIQDLQGPKLRLGDFDDIIQVQKGHTLRFGYQSDWRATGVIPTQYDIAAKVQRGERLYLYDGKVRTKITSVRDGIVYAEAENAGILVQRKGMNLPDTNFDDDVITEKDRADLAFGSHHDIDYVAMSFVHTAHDIERLSRLIKNLGAPRKIIAKIETRSAVDYIEQIVQAADAIMIARGDLAVETLPESVPIVQRQIIGLGQRYAKPTIVATQMLASMTEMPEPTRAEVSDVATAVLVGADCVMLSDETASGQYPMDAVRVMDRVIRYTERNAPLRAVFSSMQERAPSRQLAISRAVIGLASDVQAAAIVAEARLAGPALQLAAERPNVPLLAVTHDVTTAQQLAIVYGVRAYVRPASRQALVRLTDFLREHKALRKGDIVVTASGKQPGVVGATDTIKVRQLE
jgi:pyruvate kinase